MNGYPVFMRGLQSVGLLEIRNVLRREVIGLMVDQRIDNVWAIGEEVSRDNCRYSLSEQEDLSISLQVIELDQLVRSALPIECINEECGEPVSSQVDILGGICRERYLVTSECKFVHIEEPSDCISEI